MISQYEFKVTDSEGLWGSVKVPGESETQAYANALFFLEDELEPRGLLLPGYKLELLKVSPEDGPNR